MNKRTEKNYKEEIIEITEMEAMVIDILKEESTMDDCYALHPEDISEWTKIDMKKLRGVIGSLSKKGIIYIDEIISGCGEWIVLFETPNVEY